MAHNVYFDNLFDQKLYIILKKADIATLMSKATSIEKKCGIKKNNVFAFDFLY